MVVEDEIIPVQIPVRIESTVDLLDSQVSLGFVTPSDNTSADIIGQRDQLDYSEVVRLKDEILVKTNEQTRLLLELEEK